MSKSDSPPTYGAMFRARENGTWTDNEKKLHAEIESLQSQNAALVAEILVGRKLHDAVVRHHAQITSPMRQDVALYEALAEYDTITKLKRATKRIERAADDAGKGDY